MIRLCVTSPSPPFRGERVAAAQRRPGEVGAGNRSGIPRLAPTLSAPRGGEGEFMARSPAGASPFSNIASSTG